MVTSKSTPLQTLAKQSQRLLPKFIDEKLTNYIEPTKEGTPRGEPVGFSKAKYRATLEALREKVLPETDDLSTQAKRLRVAYGVLRKWRSEPQFKQLVAQHEKEFIQELTNDDKRITAAVDQLKRAKAELEQSTLAMLQQDFENRKTDKQPYQSGQKEAVTKLMLLLHGTMRDEFIKEKPTRQDLRTYQQLVLDNAIRILEDREMAIKHRVDVVRLLKGVKETLR